MTGESHDSGKPPMADKVNTGVAFSFPGILPTETFSKQGQEPSFKQWLQWVVDCMPKKVIFTPKNTER